ncbi:MAG: hypothetical protein ABSD58_10440 [Verrucomicrobiia bacterium]
MQSCTVRGRIVVGVLAGVLGLGLVPLAHPQTNSWINFSDGKWETATNWSLDSPPSANLSGALITNAGSKIVTIDAVTASNYPGSMTISNLTVSAPTGSTNTLLLSGAGGVKPFTVLGVATILPGGLIDIENSSLQFGTAYPFPGCVLTNDGTLLLGSGGMITISNPPTFDTSNNELVNELIIGGNATGQMTVSTGTVACVGGGEGIAVGYNANSQGTLTIQDGASLTNFAAIAIGQSANSQGAIWMTGGELVATDLVYQASGGTGPGVSFIGNSGKGQMTISNGTAILGETYVGYVIESQGTLTIAGGSLTVVSYLNVGTSSGGAATVWVTGGQLTTTNYSGRPSGDSGIFIGSYDGEPTTMVISNGTVLTSLLNASGTLTVAGGNLTTSNLNIAGTAWFTGGQTATAGMGQSNAVYVGGKMIVSNGTVSTGPVNVNWSGTLTMAGGSLSTSNLNIGISGPFASASLTGGQLNVTNGSTIIGLSGAQGTLTVTGGSMQGLSMVVGQSLGDGRGFLVMSGGTVSIWSNLVVGDCHSPGFGSVTVYNLGSLLVTNASHTAFLDVRDGTLTVTNGGLLQVDTLVMTNSCGLLVPNGGTIIVSNLVLDPNLSALGDGIPNGWKQQYNLNPLDPNLANEDLDGTGFTVLQGYLAGVDPTNPAAAFRITSIVPTGNNLLVTWIMGPNRTNALQASAGNGSGEYNTNGFVDIFAVTNTIGTVTNYLDAGAATNLPSRYYRVRIVP